jgi:uncharacterized damage-inducible protein DinB
VGPGGRAGDRAAGRRALIGRLAGTPIRLRRLSEGIGVEQATRQPAPAEWSAAEVVLHLVESDRDVLVPRLRRLLAEETPVFDPARPERGADATMDLAVLLDVFAQARGHAVLLLERLAPDGWERAGLSPTRGRLTVEAYAVETVVHDREHLGQLNRLRGGLGLRPRRCEAGDPMPLAEIVATARAASGRILRVIETLDAETLRRRPAPAEWSMKEVMAHLLAVERDLFLPRLRRMRDEDGASFPPFDPEAWAAERDWRRGELSADLAAFRVARADTVALLESLGPDQLARTGVTPALGVVTLHEYATHVVEHDAEHLAQLESIRRAVAG